MFKRENRLVSDVKFSNSHLFSAPEFVLKEKENKLTLNRFGVVASKKIDKRAVVRNKLKRIFRKELSDLSKNMMPGHDMLFIVKIGALGKTEEEIRLSIKNALTKAGLIK